MQTGHDGVAAMLVPGPGRYRLALERAGAPVDGGRAEFLGWSTGETNRYVEIDVSSTAQIELGFQRSSKISFEFTDAGGTRLHDGAVSSITFADSLGVTSTVGAEGGRWLPVAHPVLTDGEFAAEAITYRPVEVQMRDGRVIPAADRRPRDLTVDAPVAVALYDLEIRLCSLLFGRAVKGTVAVDGNGTELMVGSPPEGRTRVPPGRYSLRVMDGGLSLPTKFDSASGPPQVLVVPPLEAAILAGLVLAHVLLFVSLRRRRLSQAPSRRSYWHVHLVDGGVVGGWVTSDNPFHGGMLVLSPVWIVDRDGEARAGRAHDSFISFDEIARIVKMRMPSASRQQSPPIPRVTKGGRHDPLARRDH